MADTENQLLGNRYQLLEKLGSGGMGTVYRAHDRLHLQDVALKRVIGAVDEVDVTSTLGLGTTNAQLALAREFQMLASLRHPHIITVLDYGFDEGQQPFFTMSLLEQAQSITKAGHGKPLVEQIKLLIELLQALVYLHHRGIVHRDLKPDNALIAADGLVKVLDFGISVKREEPSAESEGSLSGTLAYMAPEVLRGERATEAADLYAVGLIAYELIAGKHAFAGDTMTQLLQRAMVGEVDVTKLEVSDEIKGILQRLLKRTPSDRYASAQNAIVALSDAIGEATPVETSAIRESFLQAAKFVGRDKELAQLMEMLTNAAQREGGSCLVGGESGVGKSRLLDELRIQALVKGALVLRGQSVAEGGFMYHIWRDPVRRLLLSTPVTDLDASVLKQIVPDIAELLRWEIPDIGELDARAGQQRLIGTIVELFRQQKQLVVLILEDLHWSAESLDVLTALNKIAPTLPLLIIGNYRDDEKPDLPRELPDMTLLKLERLSHNAISELSVSMLGEEGSQPQVLQLLERETEGNVFFLVEVVRVLAEEAGRLSQISHRTLPRQVLAGGVEQIVQRRLNRVPESARRLLELAAVAGRQIDLKLLAALDSATGVESWLTECANVGVLEVMNEEWRFAHDKLREHLLRSLDAESLKQHHLKIAEALVQTYSESAGEYAAMISDHYEQAGALAQAVQWYVRAGKQAQATYAADSALAAYEKALALWDQVADDLRESAALRLDSYAGLAEIMSWQFRYEDATNYYTMMKTAAEAQNDLDNLAIAWRGLATSRMNAGDFKGALEPLAEAEAISHKSPTGALLSRTRQLQGWCRFYLGEIEPALGLGKEALALSEAQDNPLLTAQNLNLLTALHGTLGRFDEAAQECQRALKIFEDLGAKDHAMFQVGNLGQIAAKRGDAATALTHFEDALARARQLGRRDAEMLHLNNVGGAQVRLGRYGEADATLTQVIAMSQQTRFRQVSETYVNLAECKLGQGNLDDALEAGTKALALGQEAHNPEIVVMAWRVLGQISARRGDPIALSSGDGKPDETFSAAQCFEESERLARETGMEGEQAVTLRTWAVYEIEQGDAKRGTSLWEQAREIFTRLDATLELAAMAVMPTRKVGGSAGDTAGSLGAPAADGV